MPIPDDLPIGFDIAERLNRHESPAPTARNSFPGEPPYSRIAKLERALADAVLDKREAEERARNAEEMTLGGVLVERSRLHAVALAWEAKACELEAENAKLRERLEGERSW